MPDQVAELAKPGMALPTEERFRLVGLMLESLHVEPIAEVEAARATEIDRRLADYRRGELTAIEAE